jgi:hypothetical protein
MNLEVSLVVVLSGLGTLFGGYRAWVTFSRRLAERQARRGAVFDAPSNTPGRQLAQP